MPSTNPVVPPDRAQEKRIEIMTNAAAREAASDITPRLREVVEIIMFYADKYGATEELLSLDDVNIESLTALINKYEVVPEDQNAIMVKIQLIVLDLMGKLDQTWYEIWNDKVKPALNHIHNTRNVASAANAEQS